MRLTTTILSVTLLIATSSQSRWAHAEDWQPIRPDELQMTSEPKAPGAAAICLYRQVDRDDTMGRERVYVRYKIFTEEGRKQANVEIQFRKNAESIRDIEARTIRPDGSVVRFDGKVYETPIALTREAGVIAKTFTLSDVGIGSIIEYRFLRESNRYALYDSRWILNVNTYTKLARFSLNPYRGLTLRYTWPFGLPPGTDRPRVEHGKIVLQAQDIPAFVSEEHMPPDNVLRYRVEFIYLPSGYDQQDPAAFWRHAGTVSYRQIESFIDRKGAMERAVRQIVSPGDSADTKLRKIYTRVQQLRNLSYAPAMTTQEQSREGIGRVGNVQDMWERGYGNGGTLPFLFLALARAAGFTVDPVVASGRNRYFFSYEAMNPAELSSNLVVVTLAGKDLYLDPGDRYAPFGQLPWYETAVKGLRLDKDGGRWVDIPPTLPADARIERKGTLQLDASGELHGHLTVTYTGLEAAWRRITERSEDEVARRKFLEQDLKAIIPAGSEITLTNAPDWEQADERLVAEFDVKIAGWGQGAGQRMLVPIGIFAGEERHTFEHDIRVQPIYFEYPFQRVDDISIALPEHVRVEAIPAPRHLDASSMVYQTAVEQHSGNLQLRRELTVNLLLVKASAYDSLRNFYQSVRAGDEQQAVLATTAGAGGG